MATHRIRHAFSSVLCAQLGLMEADGGGRPSEVATETSRSTERASELTTNGHLILNLCRHSELKDVSAKIDKLLNQIRLQMLEETWKVSLLNSLFSLFTEWEPF